MWLERMSLSEINKQTGVFSCTPTHRSTWGPCIEPLGDHPCLFMPFTHIFVPHDNHNHSVLEYKQMHYFWLSRRIPIMNFCAEPTWAALGLKSYSVSLVQYFLMYHQILLHAFCFFTPLVFFFKLPFKSFFKSYLFLFHMYKCFVYVLCRDSFILYPCWYHSMFN